MYALLTNVRLRGGRVNNILIMLHSQVKIRLEKIPGRIKSHAVYTRQRLNFKKLNTGHVHVPVEEENNAKPSHLLESFFLNNHK